MSQVKTVKTFSLSDIVDQGSAFHAHREEVGEEVSHFRHERETGELFIIMGEL